MHRPLTRRDWAMTGAGLSVWIVSGILIYRFPHSRLIWWICVAAIICFAIPRAVFYVAMLAAWARAAHAALKRSVT